ncbi:MAG: Unknown protein [uncultured Campylobacterales bacterium]|uniref:Uncharacterized protein n=1 Tax=uncultured Campylobacterales bacterium TaxID=352960 RepID=A0A6S6SIV8_9BACT|nr:MAG: Unknown protein [uncultured Campylobacterales bacterium]
MYKFILLLLLTFSFGLAIEQNTSKTLSDKNISMTLMVEGIELYKKGRYSDAISKLKKSIHIDPKNHVSHFVIGLSYDEQGNLSQNLKDIEKAYKYVKRSTQLKEENTSKEVLVYLEKKIDLIKTPREQPQYHKKECSTCPIGDLL